MGRGAGGGGARGGGWAGVDQLGQSESPRAAGRDFPTAVQCTNRVEHAPPKSSCLGRLVVCRSLRVASFAIAAHRLSPPARRSAARSPGPQIHRRCSVAASSAVPLTAPPGLVLPLSASPLALLTPIFPARQPWLGRRAKSNPQSVVCQKSRLDQAGSGSAPGVGAVCMHARARPFPARHARERLP